MCDEYFQFENLFSVIFVFFMYETVSKILFFRISVCQNVLIMSLIELGTAFVKTIPRKENNLKILDKELNKKYEEYCEKLYKEDTNS